MPYHDNWREERLRNRRDYDNDKRSMSGREKTGYPSSGYWNDDEIDAQRDDRIRRSEYRDYGDNNSRGEYYERNPNWDDNAPYSSKYDAHDYATGQNYAPGDRDISFEERERQRFLNRKRSLRGMVDPRYGDPLFSDRNRLGATGGSSNSYERGDYGDYPVYGSSGERFSNTEQGFIRHGQDRESDNAYARETRYMGTSFRGKGPKDYKRSDARIMEDVCDALYEHSAIDASKLQVEVIGGNVILSGHVNSRYAKREAETAIDYISGVQNVENRIHVSESIH